MATQLYGIKPQAAQLFDKTYQSIATPGVPVKAYASLTPVQFAAITGNHIALGILLEKGGRDCAVATDPAGLNVLHHLSLVSQLDPSLPEQMRRILEEKFPNITSELMKQRCKAGSQFPYSRALTPRELQEFLHPTFDETVNFLEEDDTLVSLTQKQLQERFGFEVSPSHNAISPEFFLRTIRQSLISPQSLEYKSKEKESDIPHPVIPSSALAIRHNPHIRGRELVYIGKEPLPPGSILPYGGISVPYDLNSLDWLTLCYAAQGVWPDGSSMMIPIAEKVYSLAMFINQGAPNCQLGCVVPVAKGQEKPFCRFTIAIVTVQPLKPGAVFNITLLDMREGMGKFWLPQSTWKNIQADCPKFALTKTLALERHLFCFYCTNPTVLCYRFLLGQISKGDWDKIQRNPLFNNHLQQCQKKVFQRFWEAISSFTEPTKAMLRRWIETNAMSLEAIDKLIQFIRSAAENDFQPEREQVYIGLGTLFDRIYEIVHGVPFGSVLDQNSPPPLSDARLQEIEAELAALKAPPSGALCPLLQRQNKRKKEKQALGGLLRGSLIFLVQNIKEKKLSETWTAVSKRLCNIIGLFDGEAKDANYYAAVERRLLMDECLELLND